MENGDVINAIVDHIQSINFNATAPGSESVSVFETTIRYLGGLLSGKLGRITLNITISSLYTSIRFSEWPSETVRKGPGFG